MRGGAIAEVERDLVDVTPAPAFGRVIAFDDWMARLVKMLRGVAVASNASRDERKGMPRCGQGIADQRSSAANRLL